MIAGDEYLKNMNEHWQSQGIGLLKRESFVMRFVSGFEQKAKMMGEKMKLEQTFTDKAKVDELE